MTGANLEWFLSRMSPRRWRLAGAAASLPLLAVLAFLGGVALNGPRVGAGIALVLIVTDLALVTFIAVWYRRKTSNLRTSGDGRKVDLTVAPPRSVLARVDSAASRALAAGRHLEEIPHHVLCAFGMATRSPFARDQLAGLATAWRFDSPALAELTQGGDDFVDALLAPCDPSAVLSYARLVDSQRLDERDRATARALYSFVARHPRRSELSSSEGLLLAENLVMIGNRTQARRVLEQVAGQSLVRTLLVLDTVNPFADDQPTAPDMERAWLAGFNAIYQRVGLEAVTLEGSQHAPFDRLTSEPTATYQDGPLISVIMTCFSPTAAALRTAVSSVVNQSWSNWELLLVDDGSPEEHSPLLEHVAGLDPRIRLITHGDNKGTYIRRNEALVQARGEFVTMHDSDDWMHPRRLEVQARHLLSHPSLMANLSDSLRVTPALHFAQPRGTLMRLAETSLLFRRELAIDRLGFFDAVRKGADSGYRRRMEVEMGRKVPVVDVQAPLTLVRYEASSLSGEDMRDGWTHPARVAYTNAFSLWLARGGRKVEHPLGSRPFPAHAHISGTAPKRTSVDVLFVLDPREGAGRAQDRQWKESRIRAAAVAGRTVAVRFVEGLISPWPNRQIWAPFQQLINDGTALEVLPYDEVVATHVIVLDETCLVGVAADSTPVTTEALTVVTHGPERGEPDSYWTHDALQRAASDLCPNVQGRRVRRSELDDSQPPILKP